MKNITPSAVVLYFTKSFKKGMLKGIEREETISFVSFERAHAWLKGVAANYKKGVLDYVVKDSRCTFPE